MQGGGCVFLVIILLLYSMPHWLTMNGYNAVYVYSIWFTDSFCDICCLLAIPEKHQVLTSNAHANYPFISLCCWCVVWKDAFGFLFLISHMWLNWGPLAKDLADLWHVIWTLYFVAEVAVYLIVVYNDKFCVVFFSWLTNDTNKIVIRLASFHSLKTKLASFHYNFRENLIRTKVKRIAFY